MPRHILGNLRSVGAMGGGVKLPRWDSCPSRILEAIHDGGVTYE